MKMPEVTIYNYFNGSDILESFIFKSNDSLPPFPFNLSYTTRIYISLSMALVLASGLHYRMLIFRFLVLPGTNKGPINTLIWIDQLNGLFLVVNTVGRIIALILPFPMSRLTGESFCGWSPLPGTWVQSF